MLSALVIYSGFHRLIFARTGMLIKSYRFKICYHSTEKFNPLRNENIEFLIIRALTYRFDGVFFQIL